MRLSKTEEELMKFLWKLDKAYLKELHEQYGEPKPAITTLATLLKRMTTKKLISYVSIGKKRQYYPLLEKEKYFSNQLNGIIKNFFNNSHTQFASFFAEKTDLTQKELEALRSLIDDKIKKN